MVDLKKISLPKVNVDTKKMMGAVDGLVDKIPPNIATLLKKIATGLLIFFVLVAIYIGWSKGWEDATPQGLQLAQDTRSLFATEIEREYNRARKDVRMSGPEDISFEANRKMEFDFVSQREKSNPQERAIPETDDFLGKEYDFRNRKNADTVVPPLATPSGDGLITSPVNIETIGTWQNTEELQELGTKKEIERPNVSLSPNLKKMEGPALKTSDLESEEDLRFKKTLDRLDQLEKKVAEKKRKESGNLNPPQDDTIGTKKKVRELEKHTR